MPKPPPAESQTLTAQVRELEAQARAIRDNTKKILVQAGANPKSKDSDYVFITFVLQHLPHGVVGLLVAVIFCATMSATSAVLNALGSTTAVDFYRPLIRPKASDHHYVVATRWLTLAWGLVAIAVASFASLVENLIEAGNILGSVFYGSILGLFLVAFFLRSVRGSAVFFAAVIAQTLVLILFFTSNIGYLWYNVIGCGLVVLSRLSCNGLVPERTAGNCVVKRVRNIGRDAALRRPRITFRAVSKAHSDGAARRPYHSDGADHLFRATTVRLFSEAFSLRQDRRPRAGSNRRSAARSSSFFTTAITIPRETTTVLARTAHGARRRFELPVREQDSEAVFAVVCQARLRRTGRRRWRGNCRTMLTPNLVDHFKAGRRFQRR